MVIALIVKAAEAIAHQTARRTSVTSLFDSMFEKRMSRVLAHAFHVHICAMFIDDPRGWRPGRKPFLIYLRGGC